MSLKIALEMDSRRDVVSNHSLNTLRDNMKCAVNTCCGVGT